MEKIFSPHLKLAKSHWQAHLRAEDLAIDATCGNGHDTHFLAQICQVIALDIQPQAIQNTKNLLPDATIFQISHDKIDEIPLPRAPRLIVYNLGYLPRGDKSITTKTDTTLISVKKSLDLLASDGALSITCYPGHDEGQKEQSALEAFICSLDPKKWKVTHYKWPEKARAPSLIWISSIM